MSKNGLDLSTANEEDIKNEILRLQNALDDRINWPKTTTYYVHSDKGSGWDLASKLGLEGDAAKDLSYICYELALDLEVHQDGKAFATHLNSVPLVEKVRV
jgi:hypothetical protein